MLIKNPTSAEQECCRFDFCDLNNCPLHKDYYKNLFNDVSDPAVQKKQKCIAKVIRKRIGIKWGLMNKGMKPREITSQKNWDDLPESVKQERINKLKRLSPVSRCLAVGLVVSPKKKSKSPEPHTNQTESLKNGMGEDE